MKKIVLSILTFTAFIGINAQNNVMDMTGSHMNLGTLVSTNVNSIECWFKLNNSIDSSNINANPILFRRANQYTNSYGLFFGASNHSGREGKLTFNIGGIYIVSDSNHWNANQWYHVAAVTKDGGLYNVGALTRLYIDGVLQQNKLTTGTTFQTVSANSGGYLRAGTWSNNNGGLEILDGKIDNIATWSRVLSAAEIQDHADPCFNIGYPGNGLRAFYNFETDTIVGTTVTDLSGNNYTGFRESSTLLSESICTSLGVNDVKNKITTYSYPNPTTGKVTFNVSSISTTLNEQISTIEIVNLTGQTVATFDKTNTIDISQLPNGVYMAKISIGGSSPMIQKLIKR